MELDGQIINYHCVFILKSVSQESTVPTLVGIHVLISVCKYILSFSFYKTT